MDANLKTLRFSSIVRVIEFLCREEPDSVSDEEYSTVASVSFVRHGIFSYETQGEWQIIHTERMMLANPGSTHRVAHTHGSGDRCIVILPAHSLLEDARSLYWRKTPSLPFIHDEQFFKARVLEVSPTLDVLHRKLSTASVDRNDPIKLEILAVALISEVFKQMYDTTTPPMIGSESWRIANIVEPIERSKAFMADHLHDQIMLSDVANAACLSEFHFCRVFKGFTGWSPYQYLLEIRLKHALLLLRNTNRPVSQIASDSGFNNLSHFITIFRQRFGRSPRRARTLRESSFPQA